MNMLHCCIHIFKKGDTHTYTHPPSLPIPSKKKFPIFTHSSQKKLQEEYTSQCIHIFGKKASVISSRERLDADSMPEKQNAFFFFLRYEGVTILPKKDKGNNRWGREQLRNFIESPHFVKKRTFFSHFFFLPLFWGGNIFVKGGLPTHTTI